MEGQGEDAPGSLVGDGDAHVRCGSGVWGTYIHDVCQIIYLSRCRLLCITHISGKLLRRKCTLMVGKLRVCVCGELDFWGQIQILET